VFNDHCPHPQTSLNALYTVKEHLCLYIWTSNNHCMSKSTVEKSFSRGLNDHCKINIHTRAEQELCYPAATFNEKGCSQVWGGDALRVLHVPIMF